MKSQRRPDSRETHGQPKSGQPKSSPATAGRAMAMAPVTGSSVGELRAESLTWKTLKQVAKPERGVELRAIVEIAMALNDALPEPASRGAPLPNVHAARVTRHGTVSLPPANQAVSVDRSTRVLAPEVLRGEVVDLAANLHCLGAMLFEAVTGKPFESGKQVREELNRFRPNGRRTKGTRSREGELLMLAARTTFAAPAARWLEPRKFATNVVVSGGAQVASRQAFAEWVGKVLDTLDAAPSAKAEHAAPKQGKNEPKATQAKPVEPKLARATAKTAPAKPKSESIGPKAAQPKPKLAQATPKAAQPKPKAEPVEQAKLAKPKAKQTVPKAKQTEAKAQQTEASDAAARSVTAWAPVVIQAPVVSVGNTTEAPPDSRKPGERKTSRPPPLPEQPASSVAAGAKGSDVSVDAPARAPEKRTDEARERTADAQPSPLLAEADPASGTETVDPTTPELPASEPPGPTTHTLLPPPIEKRTGSSHALLAVVAIALVMAIAISAQLAKRAPHLAGASDAVDPLELPELTGKSAQAGEQAASKPGCPRPSLEDENPTHANGEGESMSRDPVVLKPDGGDKRARTQRKLHSGEPDYGI